MMKLTNLLVILGVLCCAIEFYAAEDRYLDEEDGADLEEKQFTADFTTPASQTTAPSRFPNLVTDTDGPQRTTPMRPSRRPQWRPSRRPQWRPSRRPRRFYRYQSLYRRIRQLERQLELYKKVVSRRGQSKTIKLVKFLEGVVPQALITVESIKRTICVKDGKYAQFCDAANYIEGGLLKVMKYLV